MDTTDPDIVFDQNQVCNHCQDFNLNKGHYNFTSIEIEENLKSFKKEVKTRAQNSLSEYDSIIGLSGGLDSSYICHLAKELELNPLCLHFDNGWNSDIAVSNIRNLVNICDFELLTIVMDWPEFRGIQRAFFKAGVIDIELITDNAIYALAYREAKKRKIRSWISGSNYLTEHGMPRRWNWPKQDYKNIKDIYKKFEGKKVRKLPLYGPHTYALIRAFNFGGVKYFKPLDLINYKSSEAKKVLQEKYGWKSYGEKHEESVFTNFYQNYVLPKKFGVDKRLVHLSAKIRNKEITKEQALSVLEENPMNSSSTLRNKKFFLKKLNFNEDEFDKLMQEEPIPHSTYKNTKDWQNFYEFAYKLKYKFSINN
tara:strand:+ start:767 stop:1867 length:1101 start_codon:yes stop_codon:yes gene_type:complete